MAKDEISPLFVDDMLSRKSPLDESIALSCLRTSDSHSSKGNAHSRIGTCVVCNTPVWISRDGEARCKELAEKLNVKMLVVCLDCTVKESAEECISRLAPLSKDMTALVSKSIGYQVTPMQAARYAWERLRNVIEKDIPTDPEWLAALANSSPWKKEKRCSAV